MFSLKVFFVHAVAILIAVAITESVNTKSPQDVVILDKGKDEKKVRSKRFLFNLFQQQQRVLNRYFKKSTKKTVNEQITTNYF